MDARDWDDKYGQSDLVWSMGPNQWIEEVAGDLPLGKALDLAAGEGRNAIWLASRGWDATAIDFSAVALERAQGLAAERLGPQATRFHTRCEDLSSYAPTPHEFDLVIVVYLQVPATLRTPILQGAAEAVRPGGMLIVTAHDSENARRGFGGPPNPEVLYTAADVVQDIAGRGLDVTRDEMVVRHVQTPEGPREALDCLVVATRPT